MKLNRIFISLSTVVIILFIFPQTSDACKSEAPAPVKIKKLVCSTKWDCDEPEECFKGKCTLKCSASKCGLNASCYLQDGKEVCSCPEGFSGNPHTHCKKICEIKEDCEGYGECFNKMCSERCQYRTCRSHAACYIEGDQEVCSCSEGYTGDPSHCVKMCFGSEDCKPNQLCREDKCTHECDVDSCGINAACEIRDSVTFCNCPPGLTGDAYSECSQTCSTNNDCKDSEICTKYGQCVPSCEPHVCGHNAVCHAENHGHTCTCPVGSTGDPSTNCEKMCETHSDCEDSEECYNKRCTSKCSSTPGSNALCHIKDHKCVCTCPEGFNGDPYKKCEKSCSHFADCDESSLCRNGMCITECDLTQCGVNATCKISNRYEHCICPPGTTGSPHYSCGKICNSDDDCADAEECGFRRQCVPVCDQYSCASNATCHVENRTRTCTCAAGFTGDPKYECKKVCNTNEECADHEKCNDKHQCIPVCKSRSCGAYASCSVVNHAVVCTCYEGAFGDPYTQCTQNCTTNENCDTGHKCENNKCVDACNSFKCGPKQVCWTTFHTPECFCRLNSQIPLEACEKYCEKDWDCDGFRSCRDYECSSDWGF